MIQRLFAALSFTAILLFAGRPASAADLYTLDPAHTSIVFSVAHSGFSFTYGMFREASGTYLLDKTNPANSKFRISIKANSLFTNNDKRDEHLRSSDFFNVQQFPEITFDSTKCDYSNTPETGIVYRVTGNLTIHGVTKPVTLNLRMLGEGTGPYGDQRTGFQCQTELKRTDFGMTNLLEKNLVGENAGITISFEGTQQAPTAGTGATR